MGGRVFPSGRRYVETIGEIDRGIGSGMVRVGDRRESAIESRREWESEY